MRFAGCSITGRDVVPTSLIFSAPLEFGRLERARRKNRERRTGVSPVLLGAHGVPRPPNTPEPSERFTRKTGETPVLRLAPNLGDREVNGRESG